MDKNKEKVPASLNEIKQNKHGAKICFRHNLNKGICEIINYQIWRLCSVSTALKQTNGGERKKKRAFIYKQLKTLDRFMRHFTT